MSALLTPFTTTNLTRNSSELKLDLRIEKSANSRLITWHEPQVHACGRQHGNLVSPTPIQNI
jgi:hypothetical protein